MGIAFSMIIWVLLDKVKVLRRENKKFLLKHFDDLKQEVKHRLATSNEIRTIRFLRKEKGMSLVDAKQIVDSIKKGAKWPP